jgi:hypothetical protein
MRVLDHDPAAREEIARLLGRTVNNTVRDHLAGISQEPSITSRIAQTLETKLEGKGVLGHRIRILTQDIPDRGSKSLEKPLGADLYVGISVISSGIRQTKGFLVQAKISDKLVRHSDLDEDCEKMLRRSAASYVWLYEKNGVRIVNAQDVVKRGSKSPKVLDSRRASTVFARTLECTEGDFGIGLPSVDGTKKAPRVALGEMLEELRVPQGVGIIVSD